MDVVAARLRAAARLAHGVAARRGPTAATPPRLRQLRQRCMAAAHTHRTSTSRGRHGTRSTCSRSTRTRTALALRPARCGAAAA
jgi:hypothetical protein